MSEYLYMWKDLPVILTKHAYSKANDIQLSLLDIIDILEYSDDCLKDKREKNKFEKCIKWRNNDLKIVFKKSYSINLNTES